MYYHTDTQSQADTGELEVSNSSRDDALVWISTQEGDGPFQQVWLSRKQVKALRKALKEALR